MASNIDPTQPPEGNATTAAMRANMLAAKNEIEALQILTSRQDAITITNSAKTLVLTNPTGSTGNFTKMALDTLVFGDPTLADLVDSAIIFPEWANFVEWTVHMSVPIANPGVDSFFSLHLWRSVPDIAGLTAEGEKWYLSGEGANYVGLGPQPTPECHYHKRSRWLASADLNYMSDAAPSGKIPKMHVNEKLYFFANQQTGVDILCGATKENWMSAKFSQY